MRSGVVSFRTAQGITGACLKLKPEDDVLVACTATDFCLHRRDRVIAACERAEVDWDLVYRAAVAHKIAPLVYSNLLKVSAARDLLPREVAQKFRDMTIINLMLGAKKIWAMTNISQFFVSRSHDVMLLKHAGFSLRSKPLFELTTSQDVDVVVKPSGASRFGPDWSHSLKSCNTDAERQVIDEFYTTICPMRTNILLEIDNRVHHDLLWHGVLPAIDFTAIWTRAVTLRPEWSGHDISIQSDYDTIITSCIHIIRKPHISLRNLLEISEIVKTNPQFDWDRFVRMCTAFRCGTFVYTVLSAVESILGERMGGIRLRSLGRSVIRNAAVRRLIHHYSPCRIVRARPNGWSRSLHVRSPMDLALRFLSLEPTQTVFYLKDLIKIKLGTY
jgi:Uncharacterised nucleotidyltransferase